MKLSRIFIPPRYAFLKRAFPSGEFTLLDVGCGHLSWELVRHYFPNAKYHGVDLRRQGDERQYGQMDHFYNLNLETSDFREIPDQRYDAVIFSHTIEHLANGLEVLEKLTRKVKVGGYLYVEFPSRCSLYLPSAEGTLSFFDDPTHIRFYDIKDVVNVALKNDIRVLQVGKARNVWKMILVTPVALLHNAYHLIRYRKLSAKGMLEITGFADKVLGVKHDIPPERRLGHWI